MSRLGPNQKRGSGIRDVAADFFRTLYTFCFSIGNLMFFFFSRNAIQNIKPGFFFGILRFQKEFLNGAEGVLDLTEPHPGYATVSNKL